MGLKKVMQDNKQVLAAARDEGGGDEGIEAFRPADVSATPTSNHAHLLTTPTLQYSRKSGVHIPTRWTDDEIEVALDGKEPLFFWFTLSLPYVICL